MFYISKDCLYIPTSSFAMCYSYFTQQKTASLCFEADQFVITLYDPVAFGFVATSPNGASSPIGGLIAMDLLLKTCFVSRSSA